MAIYGKGIRRVSFSDDEDVGDVMSGNEVVNDLRVYLGVTKLVSDDISGKRKNGLDEDELTKSPKKLRNLVTTVKYDSPRRNIMEELMAASTGEARSKVIKAGAKSTNGSKQGTKLASASTKSNATTSSRRSTNVGVKSNAATSKNGRIESTCVKETPPSSTDSAWSGLFDNLEHTQHILLDQPSTEYETESETEVRFDFIYEDNLTSSEALEKKAATLPIPTNSKVVVYGEERTFLLSNDDALPHEIEETQDMTNINDLRSQSKNEHSNGYDALELIRKPNLEIANSLLITTLIGISNEALTKNTKKDAKMIQILTSIIEELQYMKNSNGKTILQWLTSVTLLLLDLDLEVDCLDDFTTSTLLNIIRDDLDKLKLGIRERSKIGRSDRASTSEVGE